MPEEQHHAEETAWRPTVPLLKAGYCTQNRNSGHHPDGWWQMQNKV